MKVSNRIRPGSAPWAISQATRCTSVAVLPVPAPATTSSGPSPWATAWRCCGLSRASRASIEEGEFMRPQGPRMRKRWQGSPLDLIIAVLRQHNKDAMSHRHAGQH